MDSVTCAGTSAVVSGQIFTCNASVASGTNSVTLASQDHAGHTSTRTRSVFVGDAPPPAAITLNPAKMAMIAGEVRTLGLSDERGDAVSGGTWTVSDPAVAEVTVVDGTPTLQALAAGEAMLTFTLGALSAAAEVTVLAAGASFPSGTVLWELNGAGIVPPKRGRVLSAVPSGEDGEQQAALFFVDEGTEWADGQLQRLYERPTRIHAATADGRLLRDLTFNDEYLHHGCL